MHNYIFLLVAFILSLFVGGKWNFPLAAWLAPIFFIHFYRRAEKAGRNFLLLWLVSALATIISWHGATLFSPLTEIGFFFALAPISLIPYVIDRMYYRRFGSNAWVTLVFPIAFAATDFFSSNGSPLGTFGAIGYSQREFLPVMQIASVTGVWGITFLIGWFASLINHLWDSGFKFTRLSLTFACLLVLSLSLGWVRILLPAQSTQTAVLAGFSLPNGTLAIATEQLISGDETGLQQTTEALNALQLKQIQKLANEGANIVTLQEGAVVGRTAQIEKMLQQAGEIAKAENIYIVLPTFDFEKNPPVNAIQIIDPTGKVVLTHIKYGGNMFEGTLPGDKVLQTVDTPYGKISAIICWDADFPNIVQQAGEQNVNILFVPSQDWLGIRDIHAGMSTFRAVENGMTVFRQTGQGVSLVSDAHGKILNRTDSFEQEPINGITSVQVIKIPVGSVNTFAPQLGDLFGNAMLVSLLGLGIGLWFTRKMI